MRIRGLIVMVGLLCAAAGCKSAPSNPLIGTWISTTPADAYGAAGCPSKYVFTSTGQTDTTSGQDTTIKVTYTVETNLVWVNMQVGSNGYAFTSPDTVKWSSGPCTYKRG